MTARVCARWAMSMLILGWPAIVTGQIRLSGSVTAIEGTPIAGAEVSLFASPRSYDEGRQALSGEAGEPLARVLTDGAGAWALDVPTAGIWLLRAGAAGRSTVERPVTVEHPETLSAAILPERHPTPLRVLRRDGSVLPANELRGLRLESNWIYMPTGWRSAPQTLSYGPGGEPLVDAWPASGWTEVVAYLPGVGELGPLPPFKGLRFMAFDVVQQPVRVRDAHRRPVAGAIVRQGQLPCGADLTGAWTSGIGRGIEISWTVGTTDAEGKLEVPLPPGCRVTLTAYTALGAEGSVAVKLQGRAPEGIATIDLVEARTVTGRVVDSTSGAGIGGALIYGTGDPAGWALSDADGALTLRLAPPDAERWKLLVKPEGFFYSIVELQPSSAGGCIVEYPRAAGCVGQPRRPLPLPLSPIRWLRGRVVGIDGAPIAGAGLVIDDLGADPADEFVANRRESAGTDADGAFSLPVRDGARYGLRLSGKGYATRLGTVGAGTDAPIGSSPRFVLDRGQTGIGRVVDSEGRPIAGAAILCDIDQPPPDESEVRGFEGIETTSDENGRFRLENLGARPYVLTVRAPGRTAVERDGIRPADGEGTLDLGDVVLGPPAS